MNDAQRQRLEKVREQAAALIRRYEAGARFHDERNGDDMTETLFETAQFVVETADRMLSEGQDSK